MRIISVYRIFELTSQKSDLMRMMVMALPFLFGWLDAQAQLQVQVTTLDTFNTNATGQIGVHSLSASVIGDHIALTYYSSGPDSLTRLIFAVRDDSSLTTETVAIIPKYTKSLSSTAMQVDSSGRTWVYAGFLSDNVRFIKAYLRSDTGWIESFSLNQLGTTDQYVSAATAVDVPGFAYSGIRIAPTFQYPVHFAEYRDSSWSVTTVSEVSKSEKTRTSMVNRDGTLYLAFAESRCPDTLITRVWAKADSVWNLAFEDLWSGMYDCEPLTGRSTKLGADGQGIYLLQDIHLEDSIPQLFRLEDTLWTQVDVNFLPEWSHPFNMISRIQTDASHNICWISQDGQNSPGISIIHPDGESGYIPFPPGQYKLSLQDMVILNDQMVVYYSDGNPNFPWGKAVTFREARIPVPQLVHVQDWEAVRSVHWGAPTPNPTTGPLKVTYTLSRSSRTSLTLSDPSGRVLKTLMEATLPPGDHEAVADLSDLPAGWYVCTLSTDGFRESRPVLLIR